MLPSHVNSTRYCSLDFWSVLSFPKKKKKKREKLAVFRLLIPGNGYMVSKERFPFPCQQQEIIIFIPWGKCVWISSQFSNSPWSIFAFNYKALLVSQGNLRYSYLAHMQKTFAKLNQTHKACNAAAGHQQMVAWLYHVAVGCAWPQIPLWRWTKQRAVWKWYWRMMLWPSSFYLVLIISRKAKSTSLAHLAFGCCPWRLERQLRLFLAQG